MEAESVENTEAEETEEEPASEPKPEPGAETQGADGGNEQPVGADVRSSEESEASAEGSEES